MRKKMPPPNKDDRIHLRIQESIKDDALAVANLRGLKLSSLIHNLLVEAINKEKSDRPALLADEVKRIIEQGGRIKRKVPVTRQANVVDRGKPEIPHKRKQKLARKR